MGWGGSCVLVRRRKPLLGDAKEVDEIDVSTPARRRVNDAFTIHGKGPRRRLVSLVKVETPEGAVCNDIGSSPMHERKDG